MEILETVVFIGSLFIVIYLFIAQPNQVKGESMMPTFQNGNYIFTSKVTYKMRNPQRGDVVWLHFTPQVGHEQAGRRPALVLSPENYNRRTGLAIVAPITNQSKNYPFELPIPTQAGVTGVVLCDQTKSLDWRGRRAKYIASLPENFVESVAVLFAALLPLP